MYIEYVSLGMVRFKDGKRIRKDFGSIRKLSQSMKVYGLINPILLTKDYYLVAGHRRYLAAKELGWLKIPCIILPYQISKLDMLQLEFEENWQRKEFDKRELAAYRKKRYRLTTPWFRRIFRRFSIFFKRFFRRKSR
jgi:ParB family chromosome partitioning protein